MYVTEAAAKTKWCPFVRYLATFRHPETSKLETAGSYNRGAVDSALGQSRCIASECMAWRWAGQDSVAQHSWAAPGGDETAEPTRPPEVPTDAKWYPADSDAGASWIESNESHARREAERRANPRGRCGLAGEVY
jgi:hypothetical protein